MCGRRTVLALACTLVISCDRTRADDGLDASLHVEGAQFFREPMPDGAGPHVRTLTVGTAFVAGSVGKSCTGELDPEATAVAIGLTGDLGYWIARADIPSASAPDSPTFSASLSFARTMKPGPRELVVRAIDTAHRFGPPLTRTIEIRDRVVPDGQLVVSLTWDNGADLDLHVVDPQGVEIFKRNPNSYEPPPPGAPKEAPGTPHDGGVLDFDSNASCVEDGRRAENVVWADAPPVGRYLVRVDTMSLCGEPVARWRVQAILRGSVLASVEGIATDADTRYAHNRGAGVLALQFDVPVP